jgi:Fe-S cluster biogenesis protein NfuA
MSKNETLVQEVLETLRSAMETDGGGVEIVSVKDGEVTVKFKGACLLCPSLGMTFDIGIVKTLKNKLPWIKSVVKIS